MFIFRKNKNINPSLSDLSCMKWDKIQSLWHITVFKNDLQDLYY